MWITQRQAGCDPRVSLSVAVFAAADGAALFKQLRPCHPVNNGVDAATTQQPSVGSVSLLHQRLVG